MESGRERLLKEAIEAVEARGRSYGPPGEHFARTCGAANAILGDLFARPITPADWARLMILDKLARDAERAKLDNCLDVAGYAACLAEIRHYGQEVAEVPEVAGWALEASGGLCGLVGEDEG
jgi:hypothetical protein